MIKSYKLFFSTLATLLIGVTSFGQSDDQKVFTTRGINDTGMIGMVTVQKDYRIELLGNKMREYNTSISNVIRSGRGYRLMLLSTNDRAQAMNLRTQLLQLFPDQKVYMLYQAPFIKIKFGDFLEKTDAIKYREQLKMQRLVPGNIYVLSEIIEIKPDPSLEEPQ